MVGAQLVTDEALLSSLSTRFRLKLADVSQSERQAREIVSEQVARRYEILPIRITDSYLEIATANPFDLDCEKTLAFATGREVRIQLASPSKIREKVEELYRPENVLDQLIEGMGTEAEITQLRDQQEAEELTVSAEEASQRPVVRLVDLILSEGILSRSSDIHIEPEEGGVAVRYRIDGVLRQVMKIPRAAGLPLISRIKIISGLDIADRLRPQDGRARVAVNGVPVDLRISTLPASLGEKVVVRVLDSTRTILSLEKLGLNPDEAGAVKELLENRDGIILVTGPTGCGKTTTLYSAIRYVQSEGVNIVTVEDPVEYRLQGIVQVQVHEKAGLTFAAALRSILRQDPDVVLVGEVRDRETAQIATQASLTGHLVLSTLHTNDAPNAVTRLVDIGMEPYKIASALRGVVAQRLMRRLCSTCKEVWVEQIPHKLQRWIPPDTPVYRAVGCPECAMTGYRGRFCIVEVLSVTPEVERSIGANETADKIADVARRGGMRSLWESGISHVLRGESTIDELLRVVDVPQEGELGEETVLELKRASGPRSRERPAGEVVGQEAPERGGDGRGGVATAAPITPEFELLEPLQAEPVSATGAKVLLVDDEDQLRRVMRDLLERDGYAVAEARDGVEALDQVDRHAPDIVVLDLNLPGLDGYGVLSHLRSRPSTAGIPVVVLTARGDEDNEVRVFEMGADDFLSKPFRARALSARLQAVLGRARGTTSRERS
ncbi:MAG: response regulator [Gemmatimonadales bacterium]|nr:response regulator [Gemmatimonadales bacterium]NIN09790.1 response regulator [Gemmatimonadales bacterium]NIN48772.1 response regulator [Gemmatimonadales bacterium]NIP06236.1 response regulator [Gemmatimonadales bacterium]NIR02657.1 response regulator [Gemmatimonadales bacterium]